jgi:glutathione S-transferase
MQLKLVSFALCPYVQRAVMVLLEKRAPHEVVYIDLSDKPPWFLELSPRGKVPVLVADGTPLFESQAICEYLEEVLPEPRLMPAAPVLRARDRAWFAFAEDVFLAIFRRLTTTEAAVYDKAAADLGDRLARLDLELAGRDWLSGDGKSFGMADIALAPALVRIGVLERLGGYALDESLGNVRAWAARLLARDSTSRSVPRDFAEQTEANARKRGALVTRG